MTVDGNERLGLEIEGVGGDDDKHMKSQEATKTRVSAG